MNKYKSTQLQSAGASPNRVKFSHAKKLVLLFTIMAIQGILFCQDPHFSQYYNAPLLLNPAQTGNTTGDIRAGTNLRQQWLGPGHPFYTANMYVDGRILPYATGDNVLAVGINLMHDNTFNGILTSNYGTLSLAYHLYLDEDQYHQLSAGFAATYGNRHLDFSRLMFSTQFTSFGFDRTLPSLETSLADMKPFVSIASGVQYSYTDEMKRIELGAAGFHLNSPTQTFLQDPRQTIPLRYNATANTDFLLANNNGLSLSLLFQKQAELHYWLAGGFYGLLIAPDTENYLHIGSFYRHGDALIPYLGLTLRDWQLGFSYDITLSKLNDTPTRPNTFEISASWRANYSRDQRVKCPYSPFK